MLRVEIGPQDLQETEHVHLIRAMFPVLHADRHRYAKFAKQKLLATTSLLKGGQAGVCSLRRRAAVQSVLRKQVPLPPAGARSLLLRLKERGT